MREKSNTCCFTGHRDISALSYQELADRTDPILQMLINNGYKYFVCGGAIGFDTFAATYVCSLKKRGIDVKLVLMLPCRDQTKNWGEYEKQVYDYILSRASSAEYITDSYTSWCMHERNRRLVNGSQICIAYMKESRGGTAFTFNYALQKGLEVINVAEE